MIRSLLFVLVASLLIAGVSAVVPKAPQLGAGKVVTPAAPAAPTAAPVAPTAPVAKQQPAQSKSAVMQVVMAIDI